jgi:FkbH-like protein
MNELLSIIRDNKKRFADIKGETISVRVFSNITLNMLEPFLIDSYLKKNLKIQIKDFSYSSIIQDSINTDSSCICFIHFDSLNLSGEPLENIGNKEINYMKNLFDKITQEVELTLKNLESTKEIYLSTLSYHSYQYINGQDDSVRNYIEKTNEYFYALQEKYLNLKVINIDNILFESSGSSCINKRELFNSVAPYKFSFLTNLSDEIAKFSSLKNGKIKKVLALDCDNTLWAGTIAEDGQEGIKQDSSSKEGKIFKRIQEDANFLANNGAIICLASKNFEEDVLSFFNTKKTSLEIENISAHKINWRDKASNLKEIANELNLGIDSFIFVDDTDHEINLVRTEAPEVETLQVPNDINNYPDFFAKIRNNFVAQQSKTNKAKQYKQIFERNKEMSSSDNVEVFLEKLNIKLNIYKNKKETISRISELTQKTNQFNMTTKRYTEKEILELTGNSLVFCFDASDRFGESGITGAAVIKQCDDGAIIDTFLLSCRILGRNIEIEFLTQILLTLKRNNVKTVSANYFETPKNKKFGKFYEDFGFRKKNDELFELDLNSANIKPINYIETKHE